MPPYLIGLVAYGGLLATGLVAIAVTIRFVTPKTLWMLVGTVTVSLSLVGAWRSVIITPEAVWPFHPIMLFLVGVFIFGAPFTCGLLAAARLRDRSLSVRVPLVVLAGLLGLTLALVIGLVPDAVRMFRNMG